jgi:hypothetical protein
MDQDHIAELMHQMDSVIAELSEEVHQRETLEALVISLVDRINTLEHRERMRRMMS